MRWREESIILSVRMFSENFRIVTVFNKSIGKCSGLVKSLKTPIQPGDISEVAWNARNIDQLGTFRIENIFSPFGHVYRDATKIFAVDSACTLSAMGLPERAPHANLYEHLKKFLLSVTQENWITDYIFFELCMLSDLGYGLDLTKCAVTGVSSGLKYVSPRTGRAVTEEVGKIYKERLFELPEFMISVSQNCDSCSDSPPTKYDIFCALNITGHFLKTSGLCGKDLPISRKCMLDQFYTDVAA